MPRTLARIDAIADSLAHAAEMAAGIAAEAHAQHGEPEAGGDYSSERLRCLVAEVNGLLDHVCSQHRPRLTWWWSRGGGRVRGQDGGGTNISDAPTRETL